MKRSRFVSIGKQIEKSKNKETILIRDTQLKKCAVCPNSPTFNPGIYCLRFGDCFAYTARVGLGLQDY